MRIIHTDNFGGDYPDEKFVEGIPSYLPEKDLEAICEIINARVGVSALRFWKVVPDDYVLQPGFEL